MRSKVAASVLSIASGLCLGGVFTFTLLPFIGCGGGAGNTGGGLTTTVTAVTVSPATKTITAGDSVSFTATVSGQDNPSQVVIWSASPASAGVITAEGVFTSSSTITATTTATITATSTVPGYTKFTGSATITINPLASLVTVTSVSIALNPTSGTVAIGQTLTCIGTVVYSDGSMDNSVTYTATNGTIDPSGLYTPAAVGSGSCTATSVKDSTKSATANIVVTVAPIVIDSISPNVFFDPSTFGPSMTITGSGFAGGELFYASGYPKPSTLLNGTPPDMIQIVLIGQMRPRFINVYGTQADGTGKSNTVPFASLGTVPIAAACNDYVFADDQGDGTIRRFNRADGSNPTDFGVSGYNGGIAVDCNFDGTTNFIIINQENGALAWYDKNGNGNNGGVAGDGNPGLGVAANGHVGCTIEPSMHEAWCTPLVVGSSVQKFTSAIGTPEALGMSSGCGTNMMFSLDAQGDGTSIKLYSFSIASDGTPTLKGSVPLPEFTPASEFTQTQLANAVNWQVVPFGKSCMVAVMAPVLNASDGSVSFSLALVNATSMTEVVPGGVPLPVGSFQISADDIHGAVLAFSADVSGAQGVTRIASRLNTASAKLTTLNSTSTILASGSVLSLDGKSIDVIGWDPANDAAGLEFKPVPNN